MIYFPDINFSEYFNKKIHDFLATEFIEMRDPDDPYDSLNLFFPDYLLRHKKDKYLSIAEDLYHWSGDDFIHKLTPLHQRGLYSFLQHMESYRNDDRQQFDNIYYNDSTDIKAVKQEWNRLNKEEYEILSTTVKGFRRFIHDIGTMIDHCFEDIDFITFPYLLGNAPDEHRVPEVADLANYYSDLLPGDIANEYELLGRNKNNSTLLNDVGTALDQIAHNTLYRDHYKLFWDKNIPLNEVNICIRLEPILFAYFQKSGVEIDREVSTGTGRIDFRLRKNPEEVVLLEVKLGNSESLQSSYTKQLVHYMDVEMCLNAYFIIVCRSKDELQKGERFIDNTPNTPGKNIVVKLLDVTHKIPPSKLR